MSGVRGIDTGIPGVRIDGRSLLPVIVDEQLAARTLATGSAGDRTVVLLARGDVLAASELVAETRLHEPRNFRMRVLDADVTRAAGDPQRAINRLRTLLTEYAGTPEEAVLQHHLGLAYFGTGDFHAAHTRFTLALELREAAGAPEFLIASSRSSLAAADARLPGA
ncbi:tetratricopeptide repeat protein [Paeniglutamicibacter cryotolerans]|uniref:Putative Zn-dependent protease n=1 Tax=Paeniglutamicibacter cryotolerans TaxID=670079 RepID=A0A839QMY8_9MICC|nr:tetratricopeptide repeat protein [Paeniglutamicibacter cryotolerans]MBB2997140.1 putative Zn-dependent protease [Paeniglutamicibacter cryotolerans]